MSEVIDISPGNLFFFSWQSWLQPLIPCFIQPGICMMYSVYKFGEFYQTCKEGLTPVKKKLNSSTKLEKKECFLTYSMRLTLSWYQNQDITWKENHRPVSLTDINLNPQQNPEKVNSAAYPMSKVNFNRGMQRWFNMGRYHEQNEEEDNTQSSSTEAEKAVDIFRYFFMIKMHEELELEGNFFMILPIYEKLTINIIFIDDYVKCSPIRWITSQGFLLMPYFFFLKGKK